MPVTILRSEIEQTRRPISSEYRVLWPGIATETPSDCFQKFFCRSLTEDCGMIRVVWEPMLGFEWNIPAESGMNTVTNWLNAGESLFPTTDPLRSVDREVINAFLDVPQIRAIYTSAYENEIDYLVFLSVDKLNDDLLDRLLEREYALHRNLEQSDHLLSFSYIPDSDIIGPDIIHSGTKSLFLRR